MGTAEIVVLAKHKGLIASVEDVLRQLQGAGLWLCEDLIVALAAESDRRFAGCGADLWWVKGQDRRCPGKWCNSVRE
jgi:hypothetical protein